LFLLTEFVNGGYLAFNFQVSHVSPSAVFPVSESNLEMEWAVEQILSSVDYGHGDAFWTFWSGALNYQVVHHLFPCVAQTHYPAITPIIMETCKEFGIPYYCLPDAWSAFTLHWKYLYSLGNTVRE